MSPNWFKRNYPLAILFIAFVSVFAANFSPNTYLLGWDNRQQELYSLLNLKRYIFSVWQESQGLGLLAGHAHASEIPHALFTAFLSIFLPLNWIRQIFVFLTLFAGPVGVYFLVKKLVRWESNFLNKNIPFLGALFYLFNLSTIQTFYTPLEPFIIHYASLPWLFLSALYFIANRTKKALVFFILINVLAIPQAQIPTVFFVYLFSLSFFLLVMIIETKRTELLARSLKIILITLLLNSLWLLPFIYFYLTNGQVALEAKINQMSTETIFQQNKEFGNIFDVMLLKGFWFNNIDPDIKGNFVYMMSVWRENLNLVQYLGFAFFLVILTGFIYVKRSAPFVIPFSALFVLAFTMLATNTPPFSWIDYLLRQIPVLNEVFRFPFTKFSTLAALTYSFFFAIGVGKLYILLENRFKPKVSILYSIIPVFTLLILLFIFPVFKGNLFYEKERLKLPTEYSQAFEFFKKQNQNTRIANFPQHTFWGWNFYNWGYGGSGFIWYGIPQPILDRAFDVWSRYDENYYWEVSYALYSKQPVLLEQVLNKYQINFLLIDKNITNPSSPRALFVPETEQLLSQLNSIKKIATFGKIDIYEHRLRENVNDFVFLTHKNPKINSYKWGNFDYAYTQMPNYISSKDSPEITYQFRTLFSGKNEEDREFTLSENEKYVELSTEISLKQDSRLNIPFIGFPQLENLVAVSFVSEKTNEGFLIKAIVESPQVFLNNTKVWGKSIEKPLFIVPVGGPAEFDLSFARLNIKVNLNDSKKDLGSTLVPLYGQFSVSLTSSASFQADLSNEINSISQQQSQIDVKKGHYIFRASLPKVTDKSLSFSALPSEISSKVKSCDNFRKGKISSKIEDNLLSLESKNSTECLSFYIPGISHNQGLVIFVENQNTAGRPLHFWVMNEDQKTAVLDTYLPKNREKSKTSFVIPSYEEFGLGYSLNFENISISDEAENKLGKVSIYPIPYEFLTSFAFNSRYSGENSVGGPVFKVDHPNESLYIVHDIKPSSNDLLVLSQAYDAGWNAYEVKNDNIFVRSLPFLFGKKLNEHYLVNNWQNGWSLNSQPTDDNPSLIIVYLPQYLEYLGFLIVLLTLGFIFNRKVI